jgi:hypothetical protein
MDLEYLIRFASFMLARLLISMQRQYEMYNVDSAQGN